MPAEERDRTEEWLVEPARRPATVLELEERIDAAMRLAEAAEAAALEIGAASREAAEQARRAAALAESAAAASHASAREAASSAAAAAQVPRGEAPAADRPTQSAPAPAADRATGHAIPRRPAQPDPFDERLTAFRERAERIMLRLQRLETPAPIS